MCERGVLDILGVHTKGHIHVALRLHGYGVAAKDAVEQPLFVHLRQFGCFVELRKGIKPALPVGIFIYLAFVFFILIEREISGVAQKIIAQLVFEFVAVGISGVVFYGLLLILRIGKVYAAGVVVIRHRVAGLVIYRKAQFVQGIGLGKAVFGGVCAVGGRCKKGKEGPVTARSSIENSYYQYDQKQ